MVSRAFIRVSILSVVVLFSLITLAIGAALTTSTASQLNVTFSYASLAIAAGVITLVTVGAMIMLEFVQPGGAASMIVVEASWLTLLWSLWLASGIVASQVGSNLGVLGGAVCKDNEIISALPIISSICTETTAIVALSFIIWLTLLGYTATLIVLAWAAANRNVVGVWTSSFAEAPLFTTPSGSSTGSYDEGKAAFATAASIKTGTVQV